MKPGKLSVGQLLEEVWTRSEESQVLVPYPSKLPELISKFLLCSKLSSLQNEGIGLRLFEVSCSFALLIPKLRRKCNSRLLSSGKILLKSWSRGLALFLVVIFL